MENLVTVDGVITTDLDEYEFADQFLALIESKGWSFGGSIRNYKHKEDEEEE